MTRRTNNKDERYITEAPRGGREAVGVLVWVVCTACPAAKARRTTVGQRMTFLCPILFTAVIFTEATCHFLKIYKYVLYLCSCTAHYREWSEWSEYTPPTSQPCLPRKGRLVQNSRGLLL